VTHRRAKSLRRLLRPLAAAVLCAVVASTCGCGTFGSNQSQLFGHSGKYQAANISYRIEQPQSGTGTPGARRALTLAVRYPHPAGRAGYARVECIIERPSNSAGQSKISAMLNQVRRLTDDNLPGIALGAGVQEAMGLDVPIAELEHALVELERAPVGALPSLSASRVQVVGMINGVPVPPRAARVIELDRLAARVRRDGGLISAQQMQSQLAAPPTAMASATAAISPATAVPATGMPAMVAPATAAPAMSPVVLPATAAIPPAVPPAVQTVVPTSFAEPVVRRLPSVDVLLR